MGEYADYALDEIMTEEEFRLDYRLGYLDSLTAYEFGIIDELGYEISPNIVAPTTKTCKWCGQKELYWKDTEHGWRLATIDGTIHTCKEYGKR